MSAEPRGYFSLALDGSGEGQRYGYSLDGARELPDPASRWQPEDVHGPSAVWDPAAFAWSDSSWRGVSLADLAIYELHVGTFTHAGTFAAIIPRLRALKELGVTALELMPIAQFPGRRDWGYDGTYLNAVHNSYGGPRELQRLIDACHAAELAVILDVVYNHVGPEGSVLGEFAPYFTDRYRTPWGKAINYDDAGGDEVRRFVLQNVRQWLGDFHVDGLRLDAVHFMFDSSPWHILAEIKRVAAEHSERWGRTVHIIAESNLNDVRPLLPRERGGFALDAQWNDDFHHAVHSLLTGERQGYYADFAAPREQIAKVLNDVFAYDGGYSVYRGRRHGAPAGDISRERFVVSVQTHDQVGNRARGERLSVLAEPNRLRLGAALMLLSPFTPLLFMGEEYGEDNPFPFFCELGDLALQDAVRRGRRAELAHRGRVGEEMPDPLDERTFSAAVLGWSWPRGSWREGLRRLYGDLLTARRRWPALREPRCCKAELTRGTNGATLLRLERRVPDRAGARVVAHFNLGPRRVEWERNDDLPLLLRSEAQRYGGVEPPDSPAGVLAPWECQVRGNAAEPLP